MYTVATTISTIYFSSNNDIYVLAKTTSKSINNNNYFTQHIPLHIPRRSLNKPKPIPDYLPD